MNRRVYCTRVLPALGYVFLWMVLIVAGIAAAENCGPGTAKPNCACGDTLVTSWSTGYFGVANCSGSDIGLRLASGVTLDCGGSQIQGNGGSCGLKQEGSNSTIIGCHAFGWYDGWCNYSGGTGNTYRGYSSSSKAWLYNNTHYGAHVTANSASLLYAVLTGNGDEGAHWDGDNGTIRYNEAYGNAEEQIYLLTAFGNNCSDNYMDGGTPLYIRNSGGNYCWGNSVYNGAMHIFDNSDGNDIRYNASSNGWFRVMGNGSSRPDNTYAAYNNWSRSGTVYRLDNPGSGNYHDSTYFNGGNPDVLCQDFQVSGTNWIGNFLSGESLQNTNGPFGNPCITLY